MYQKLQQIERSSKVKVDLYDTNKVGSPILVNINELNLHIGSLYFLAHVFEILKHTELDVNGEYLFVDLGAGNGNFIKLLLKIFPNSKAIIFDIPITLVFSSYYLIKNFPDKHIGLHSDIKEISCGLEQYDIICLPHFRIEELPVNSVDMFLNTGSLSEMNENAALHYLSIIKKTVKVGGYFYTYNVFHTQKKKSGDRINLGINDLIERSKFNSFKLVS
jgi:putative sugar O-methyltransferase